jgi:predicted TPR repeat methyltransferase
MHLLQVEHAEDSVDFELRPSSCCAESGRHLRALALRHGFDMDAIDAGPPRLDQGRP